MSFLKKIFNADPDALIDKADKLLGSMDFGEAKLTYERALGKVDEARRAAISSKIDVCCDGIAKSRIAQGLLYKENAQLELAHDELMGAIEVAKSPEVIQDAQANLDTLEQDDALEQASVEPITDEERLAFIIGQWEDAQADEYDRYGEAIFSALLALNKEEYTRGRDELQTLISNAKEPRYLWLEVGRACLLCDDIDAGAGALKKFLGLLAPGQGSDARLSAHVELARIADDAGDVDEAMAEFERAVDNLPGDYRPYLAMGAYLRQHDHAPQAIEVLQTAEHVATTMEPDWRLLQELGLAYRDNDQPKKAIAHLEQVIDFFTSYHELDFPASAAVPLAQLHESRGNLERAADLYHALCQGSDGENHARYHLQAGRLLGRLGLAEEAHRMLTRAKALSENNDELLASIDKVLDSL